MHRLRDSIASLALAVLTVPFAGAQEPPGSAAQERILDAEFAAWSKESLDLDLEAARKAWADVALQDEMSIRARARAYNRAVVLSRLSGQFAALNAATRSLSASKDIYAGHRMLLMSYLVTLRGHTDSTAQATQEVLSKYDAAKKRATSPADRDAARSALFRSIQSVARAIERPARSLLPDPWQIDQRAFQLTSIASARGSRDLLARIKQLQSLQRRIAEARKAKDRRATARLLRARDSLRDDLRVRATRAIRGFRADILELQSENDSGAAESLVDIILQIERSLWPRGRVKLTLQDSLEDPVYRRSAVRRVHEAQAQRIEKLRATNPTRAKQLETWRSTVGDLMRIRAWAEAAALTLDEMKADPDFLNNK